MLPQNPAREPLRHAELHHGVAAARFNPDLKRKYEELIAAGKEKKVALTAIMRKIIVMANALIRDGGRWTTSRA